LLHLQFIAFLEKKRKQKKNNEKIPISTAFAAKTGVEKRPTVEPFSSIANQKSPNAGFTPLNV
jgi:hypothetical protein